MSQHVHADTEEYTIRWDEDVDAVVLEWHKYVSGDQFRDGCQTVLGAVRERDASKLLVDQRAITALDGADLDWLLEEWMPRAGAAGIKYAATVYQESTIAKMNTQKIIDTTEDLPGESTMGTDIEKAREWLANY